MVDGLIYRHVVKQSPYTISTVEHIVSYGQMIKTFLNLIKYY